MNPAELQILIVAEEGPSAAKAASLMITRVGADVTVVDSIEDARTLIRSAPIDAVIAGRRVADGDAMELLDARPDARPPVILIDDQLDANSISAAFRAGAADVLPTPLEGEQLVAAVQKAAKTRRRIVRQSARDKRLRRISGRLIRDRRELRRRVDLVCRDLVHAYRRLAEKVVAGDGMGAPAAEPDDTDPVDTSLP